MKRLRGENAAAESRVHARKYFSGTCVVTIKKSIPFDKPIPRAIRIWQSEHMLNWSLARIKKQIVGRDVCTICNGLETIFCFKNCTTVGSDGGIISPLFYIDFICIWKLHICCTRTIPKNRSGRGKCGRYPTGKSVPKKILFYSSFSPLPMCNRRARRLHIFPL